MNSNPLITRYAPLVALRRLVDRRTHRWLTKAELAELSRIGDQLRREQWICGRWLSKTVLAGLTRSAPGSIEILSRSAAGLGVRPRVIVAGRQTELSLSVSHTELGVLIGVASGRGFTIGVDLACGVPSTPGFRQQWFTLAEQRWLASEPSQRTDILWALKEAFFKAGNSGQPWTPGQVEVIHDQQGFHGRLFGKRTLARQVAIQRIDGQLAATVCLADSALAKSLLSEGEWISCL